MSSSSTATGSAGIDVPQRSVSRNIIVIAFLAISALYFADTLLRASLKTFWFDELFTVYLCRLPTFHATWAAVLHGVDFNPPLFYLLTRWAQHLFGGEGLIASRLPAILGFWIFGICLYVFTARRLGRLCGCIAALAPWFTLAHYYAYEARAHGAVLAWCGLMLLCWQRTRRDAPSILWVAGLFFSFFAATLTHVYAVYLAVPFLLVEADSLLHRQRPRLWTCLALLLPPVLVAPLYLQMSRAYKANVPSGGLHIHPYEVVQHYLVDVFGPGLVLLIIVLALLAWSARTDRPSASPEASFTREELIVALGFLLLPIIGIVGVKISHGPYFDRYFLACTAGYALLLAQAVAVRGRHSLVARALVAAMLFFITADMLIGVYCHWRHADLDQVEPSSHLAFSPNPAKPLLRRSSLLEDTSPLDILVTGHPDYLFLQYYAPPELRRRLIFAAPNPAEPFLVGYQRFSRWADIGLRATSFDDYFATHRDFLVYDTDEGSCRECTEKILAAGYALRSVEPDSDGRLEHFSR